ncbi:hypothetical protein SAY87_017302 [Trapa incisa]|uniref:Uncharacterized protein n=2 Tax=Trapa TaxID=22665 RepID=A0AAN7M6A0_TRANT|nr:hypothetical protein SAY87_017302 [Trapa incisa]KAK4790791.1 hypothetical protein SAY86_031204 [Trapa natans]
MPRMTRSLARAVTLLVTQPASTVTTLLHGSDLLPRHINLERLVRHDLLERENYLFRFLVNVLRCFWYVRMGLGQISEGKLKQKLNLLLGSSSSFSDFKAAKTNATGPDLPLRRSWHFHRAANPITFQPAIKYFQLSEEQFSKRL